ncbi:MAG: hypothetical protein JWO08_1595 [Verrucomicrobiaceae bacterium]|nr:hypothetical protein [Verrucomicrobiaceae bacterium]
MKPFQTSLFRILGAAAIATVMALPQASYAKDKDHDDHGHGHGKSKHSKGHHDDHDHDHDRVVYSSRPRSTFTLSLGDGYRGRGYYYGPANSSYYYERPEVTYYATREAAPREYYSRDEGRGMSTSASVQAALARRGYYGGPVDGAIGPQSRRSIARYQAEHGMRPSGEITSQLLQSLGL